MTSVEIIRVTPAIEIISISPAIEIKTPLVNGVASWFLLVGRLQLDHK